MNKQNKYKVINGTYYNKITPDAVITILERSRETGERLTLDYGDINTGKSWNEENDINGHIGRSNGKIKIPLLIKNSRSTGGGGILDHCIIAIYTAKGKKLLYKLIK